MPLSDPADESQVKIEDQGTTEREMKSEQMSMKGDEDAQYQADNDELNQALSGDQSMTQSQFLSGPQSRGPPEVKIFNNIKVVHKVDHVALGKLKQQCHNFMAQGRTEFNK